MRSLRWRIFKFARVFRPTSVFAVAIFFAVAVDADIWNDHSIRLMNYTRQIAALEMQIEGLINQKKTTQDPKSLQAIFDKLQALHKELEEISKNYEEERLHVRFKHPDRSDKVNRQYIRHRVRSLNDMEKEFGIDSRLDRAKAKVLSTFPVRKPAREDDAEDSTSDADKSKAATTDPLGYERIRLKK